MCWKRHSLLIYYKPNPEQGWFAAWLPRQVYSAKYVPAGMMSLSLRADVIPPSSSLSAASCSPGRQTDRQTGCHSTSVLIPSSATQPVVPANPMQSLHWGERSPSAGPGPDSQQDLQGRDCLLVKTFILISPSVLQWEEWMAAIKGGDEYRRSLKFNIMPGKDVLKLWFTFRYSDCYQRVSNVWLRPDWLFAWLFVWAELTPGKMSVKAATARYLPAHAFNMSQNSYNILLFL